MVNKFGMININGVRLIDMKQIDINKNYDLLIKYADTVFYENEDGIDDFYWFDKKRYKFIKNGKKKKTIRSKPERYIEFVHFDAAYSLIDYYILKINNDKVTHYFKSATDIRDATIRFRKFIDWNCVDTDYAKYDVFTEMVVKWCEQNCINYTFEKDEPNSDYTLLKDNIEQTSWQIPQN